MLELKVSDQGPFDRDTQILGTGGYLCRLCNNVHGNLGAAYQHWVQFEGAPDEATTFYKEGNVLISYAQRVAHGPAADVLKWIRHTDLVSNFTPTYPEADALGLGDPDLVLQSGIALWLHEDDKVTAVCPTDVW